MTMLKSIVLPELFAMIAGQHNNGLLQRAALLEPIEKLTDRPVPCEYFLILSGHRPELFVGRWRELVELHGHEWIWLADDGAEALWGDR